MRSYGLLIGLSAVALLSLASCQKENPAPSRTNAPSTNGDAAVAKDDHAGPVIELGSAAIGPFSVKASRDEGPIVPGKDAPIDVIATPVDGSAARVAVVRFWLGTEDSKGSIKARAEIENPAEPNHWHTHAEVPDPLPADSKLWVEIEDDAGAHHVGSFDLRQ